MQHEAAFLDALPSAAMYERSFMHRDTVTHVAVAPVPEFFFTASADGHLKFWKKKGEGHRVRQDLPGAPGAHHRQARATGPRCSSARHALPHELCSTQRLRSRHMPSARPAQRMPDARAPACTS